MSLPLAAVGAVMAALLEASVLPELTLAGAKPDLVLVMAIVAAMLVGLEEGLVWAFLGGLMLDLILSSERPVGAATFSLMVAVGVAIAAARIAGHNRRLVAVLLAFALTFLYQGLSLVILSGTTGLVASPASLQSVGIVALLNALLAFVVAGIVRWYLIRYAPAERTEWLGA